LELLEQLGIKPLSLLAQIVNFLLLLLILWRLLYKPLLKALQDRRERIEKSLKDAEQIERDLKTSRESAQQIVTKANEQAVRVMHSVEKEADQKRTDALRAAEAEASQIYKRAEQGIKEDRQRLQREVETETLQLVAQATERVIQKSMDDKKHRQLIEQALKELA